jgi:hypothetical protein
MKFGVDRGQKHICTQCLKSIESRKLQIIVTVRNFEFSANK